MTTSDPSSVGQDVSRKDLAAEVVKNVVRSAKSGAKSADHLAQRFTRMLQSETLYRRLVENMNEAVWMGDAEERTIYANPKFCEMMGYTLEEMIGKESYYFWDQESAKRVREVNMKERKKGVSSSYEGTLSTKNGTKIPVLLSGTPLPDGGTIGIMTDLRELKKRQESEELLTRAIHYASDAVIVTDGTGSIVQWNRGAKLLFGYKQSEIESKPLGMLFPTDDVSAVFRHGQVRYNSVWHGTHKSGQRIVVSATLTPVLGDASTSTARWLVIARDITTQTKFEEELALKYEKLRDAYNQFGIVRRQMDYLFDLVELCGKMQNLQSVCDFIVNAVIMLTRVDACVLQLYDVKRDMLEMVASFGLSADWRGASTTHFRGSITEKAFKQKSSIKIIDVTKEPRFRLAQLAKKSDLSSMLLIPLIFRGKLIGSLSLYARSEKRLEIFENEFIEQYARLISVAVAVSQGDS